MLPTLYRTRNVHVYPDKAMLKKLSQAALKHMLARGETVENPDEEAVLYLAPLSPVSNDIWVYWENGQRLLCFSSDADHDTPAYWSMQEKSVEIYDLRQDVQVFALEHAGSNAYVKKDWAGRVLFNCIVLGKRIVIPAAERMVNQPDAPQAKP